MKHPGEVEIALLAGRELPVWKRWWMERHAARCPRCSERLALYRADRELIQDPEVPEGVNWNRLAAEMKANIRLGLAAGECVAPAASYAPRLGWRAAVAAASVTILILAGWWLNVPAPKAQQGILLEATSEGIELRENGRGLALINSRAEAVTYTVNAHGALRARYVDAETGQVTINNVYVE